VELEKKDGLRVRTDNVGSSLIKGQILKGSP